MFIASPSCRYLSSAIGTGLIILATMTGLLIRNNEFYTTSAGTRAQFASNGIYGRSIWDDFLAFKFALYELRPTQSLSIGSSRAMSVRALLFRNGDHLSAGGAINSLDEMHAAVDEIEKLPKRPSVIFLYLDFSWFIADGSLPRGGGGRSQYESLLFLYQSAFVHLPDLLVQAFAEHLGADPETGGALVGSRASRLASGFRRDGSNRQYIYRAGRIAWPESDIAPFLSDPESAEARSDARNFVTKTGWIDAKLRADGFNRLESELKRLRSLGAAVVVVLPPVAPHVAAALETWNELAFFGIWRAKLMAQLSDMSVPMFNFTHLPLRSPDCYFDRYHGSEGAYAWMLAQMRPTLEATSHPAARVLDRDALQRFGGSDCVRSLQD